MDAKLQSVLEKIAKLRALAAGAATQAEAEAAAAQAAALIAKYQIEEAQIDAADPTRSEAVGEDAPLWTGKRFDGWLSCLCAALTKDHGCFSILGRGGSEARVRIAGRPSDVAIVRYLFAWLMMEILRLSEREHGRAAKNAFRLGAVNGVIAAMRAARAAEVGAAAQRGTSVSLATVDRAALSKDFLLGQLNGRVTGGRSISMSDRGAFLRGKEAGSGLTPQKALPTGGRFMLGAGR